MAATGCGTANKPGYEDVIEQLQNTAWLGETEDQYYYLFIDNNQLLNNVIITGNDSHPSEVSGQTYGYTNTEGDYYTLKYNVINEFEIVFNAGEAVELKSETKSLKKYNLGLNGYPFSRGIPALETILDCVTLEKVYISNDYIVYQYLTDSKMSEKDVSDKMIEYYHSFEHQGYTFTNESGVNHALKNKIEYAQFVQKATDGKQYIYLCYPFELDDPPAAHSSSNNNTVSRPTEPKVGMTQSEVINIWGEPTKKNVTETKYGTHEQWVYRDKDAYVYFDDGVCTSIQTSE